MLNKEQCYEAIRCVNTECKNCTLDNNRAFMCIEQLGQTGVELYNKLDKLQAELHALQIRYARLQLHHISMQRRIDNKLTLIYERIKQLWKEE